MVIFREMHYERERERAGIFLAILACLTSVLLSASDQFCYPANEEAIELIYGASIYRARTLGWLFRGLRKSSTVQRRERAGILNRVFAFFLQYDLTRDHRLREVTAFGHKPRENVREVYLILVFGAPFTSSHHLSILPFPNPLIFILLQSLPGQAEPIHAGFAESRLDFRLRALFTFKPINFGFEVEELRMLRYRSFFSSREFAGNTAFVELGKGLEIVDEIMLCAERRGICHTTSTADAWI